MPELTFSLVDEATFDEIPDPARPDARCRTCDYWERIDGGRGTPEADAPDAVRRASLKRQRLLAGRAAAGSYAMLAHATDAARRRAVGYAQFGPLSAYARALSIRERYPELPESPAPWVVTCLQVVPGAADAPTRTEWGVALLEAVCDELDRRGITALEAYPEVVPDAWLPSTGPIEVYKAARFERAAGDDRFPVLRRELSGETDAEVWSDLLRASRPADDDEDGWPLPLPPKPDEDLFRLPPERPKRPNPFGED